MSSRLTQEAAAHRVTERDDVGSIAELSKHVPRDVTKFTELVDFNMVHPNVINEITKGMGHHTMTEVQSMTINQALQGTDMYVSYFDTFLVCTDAI